MKQIISIGLMTLFFYINCNCTELVDSVPSEYFEGIKSVTFVKKPFVQGDWRSYQRNELSFYFWNSKRIKIYSGCDYIQLVHELSHSLQQKKGISLYQARQHDETFREAYDEIEQAVKG